MKIGIVGLWHLGSVLTASWLKLGHSVVGVDFDELVIQRLSKGNAPIYEKGVDETIQEGLEAKRVLFSVDPADLENCDFVFLAYDTPVDEQDVCDVAPLEKALEQIAPFLRWDAILIVSSQVPVGTCRRFQEKIGRPIIYCPENLRLGEAMSNYLNPGHLVIGSDNEKEIEAVCALFAPIPATRFKMDLSSAEMAKHAINSYLAASITFANQLSNACQKSGADFTQVVQVMREDPRIGKKAYLKAGIGFSGGTLGRDLRILTQLNQPFFKEIWELNQQRPRSIVYQIGRILGQFKERTIGILGLTYKPETSTLRRSIPLQIGKELIRKGVRVQVYDPKANWTETNMENFQIKTDPYLAAQNAHFLLVFTEWEEFKHLDYQRLASQMKEKRILDPSGFLDRNHLQSIGFSVYG